MERHEEAKPLAWLRPARVTTQRATARKEAQRPQARCQRLNRVRSALTQKVNLTETEIFNVHMHSLKKTACLGNLWVDFDGSIVGDRIHD